MSIRLVTYSCGHPHEFFDYPEAKNTQVTSNERCWSCLERAEDKLRLDGKTLLEGFRLGLSDDDRAAVDAYIEALKDNEY